MVVSTSRSRFKVLSEPEFSDISVVSTTVIPNPSESQTLSATLLENCLGGILIVTKQQQLVYANGAAHRVLNQLQQGSETNCLIPDEIWHICQALIQSRHLFPEQNWLIEFDIFTNAAATLHI